MPFLLTYRFLRPDGVSHVWFAWLSHVAPRGIGSRPAFSPGMLAAGRERVDARHILLTVSHPIIWPPKTERSWASSEVSPPACRQKTFSPIPPPSQVGMEGDQTS